ncbi:pyridoxamine 5'-phosphate oxidase family protein [Micromonospora yangpuensis]|uniref:PPOX class probable F420-dependent enzyme n=1 Tax=Micromonospora yangpuensis TaxID=683228 RepID=A0A1C6U0V1_9ACTN|nr:TIGR03618 family F420-dependent PPOX class oxidoreductase [Micromonospora yangpuensis]GGM11374.1 PPOX class F420-dependent enzyme [Micromonospora yangpuensis]SCL47702.1 PPOX class probable F420-dependent enzyme [Micromonospora yangpuensis]
MSRAPVDHRLDPRDDRVARFCGERHLATLTTVRPDGTPHVVPVGVTFDAGAGLARVITSRTSRKARLVAAAPGTAVAVCHVDGRRWLTIEGRAVVRTDPAAVREAERRYTERYRPPRPNPDRVVIEITVTRLLGSL